MEAKTLNQLFGFGDQLFKGSIGILRLAELEHLYLIELVTANHTAFVGTVRTGFTTEAGGVSKQFLGQIGLC